jgi:hypothetical protein
MNLSSKMRFSKFSNKIQAFSFKAYRKSEQKSQSNKTWISSSTEFVLQNIHYNWYNVIVFVFNCFKHVQMYEMFILVCDTNRIKYQHFSRE